MPDAELETLRQELIRQGDLLGHNRLELAHVRRQLRALAEEQARRGEAIRHRRTSTSLALS